jgi:hypothetical protein
MKLFLFGAGSTLLVETVIFIAIRFRRWYLYPHPKKSMLAPPNQFGMH